jgi:hypothetical protein
MGSYRLTPLNVLILCFRAVHFFRPSFFTILYF